MKRLLLSLTCLCSINLVAAEVEYSFMTHMNSGPAVVKLSYDPVNLSSIALTSDGEFMIDDVALPSSELTLTDAASGAVLTKYKKVRVSWQRKLFSDAGGKEVFLNDVHVSKTYASKSATLHLTHETPMNQQSLPWNEASTFGSLYFIDADFSNALNGYYGYELYSGSVARLLSKSQLSF
ncbi:hypothetical protein [Alteromonas portus]|uniref:hypothetical protein n=1 Tax=Alteromonas portus TaxID=2565549 RepID=UPI003BF86726